MLCSLDKTRHSCCPCWRRNSHDLVASSVVETPTEDRRKVVERERQRKKGSERERGEEREREGEREGERERGRERERKIDRNI